MAEIHEVFSVTKTVDGALLIDLDFTGFVDERDRVFYVLRDGDEFGSAPMIRQWIADNNPEILPYIPPPELTPEELRAQMPPISKRQLRLTLVRNDISLSELDTAINSMGDEAIIEWNDSSEYRRLNPLLNQVADYLDLSQDKVDAMWQQALEA